MGGVRGMTAQEVGLYTMLLCRMYEEDGPIERDDFKLATYCGMRQATFTATLEKLIRLGKITSTDGLISNDRAETEISNRAHDLEIAIRAGKASAEKRQQKQRDEATPVQRSFNHTDTDTDTVKTEPIGSAKKPRRKPEIGLPEGWVPNDCNISDAQAKGFSAQEIDHEADRFRDYHTAKDSRYRDWNAAWRTWLGNARKFGGHRGMASQATAAGYGQGGSIASIVARRRLAGEV
jgi:uncharacterized protein YdaU (DUF1376 family)